MIKSCNLSFKTPLHLDISFSGKSVIIFGTIQVISLFSIKLWLIVPSLTFNNLISSLHKSLETSFEIKYRQEYSKSSLINSTSLQSFNESKKHFSFSQEFFLSLR